MLVECVYNKVSQVKDRPALCKELQDSPRVQNGRLFLTIGKVYVVYCLSVRGSFAWYFICDDVELSYPVPYAAPLFKLIDPRLSRYWICSLSDRDQPNTELMLTFREWASDGLFYEKLVEDARDDPSAFAQYKVAFDCEFPDPSVETAASVIDKDWLLCPKCEESWQCVSSDGMVTCPECQALLHNPLYVHGLTAPWSGNGSV
jgi:hypothetical protein